MIRQIILALIGLLGAAVFVFFFVLTFNTPHWVESFAADFIEQKASEQIDEKIDSIQPPTDDSVLGRIAGVLYDKNEAEIERLRESLRNNVHEQMATAIAQIRDLDCDCRAMWAEWLKERNTTQVSLLQNANEKLTEFIHTSYAQVVDQLKRDIRIFTGTNAVMFLLLLLIVWLKPQASLQLFVPGLLLAVATLICSYFYIFEQNWLLTIIYNDYLGFGYLVYLGLVFGLLCDIVLNRTRVTTEIVNAFLNAIGSAASAVPC